MSVPCKRAVIGALVFKLASNHSRGSSQNLIRIAERNAFRRRGVRQQSRLVRPSQSKAETQPQLQPRFLRLSAMISQYFTLIKDGPVAILGTNVFRWASCFPQVLS